VGSEEQAWWERDADYSEQGGTNVYAYVDRLRADATALRFTLENALLQIEYLNEKFMPTGSGNQLLVSARAILDRVKR